MHNHFDQFLNLKRVILERKPKIIVECGAGAGDLTRQLASLLDVYPFELHVISDKVVEGLDSRVHWMDALSYEALQSFPEDSIGLCIIDTDHNYWTLREELRAVVPKIVEGGLIAFHDVETFYHDTGMALSYWNNKPYPRAQIEGTAHLGSLGDALIDFLYSDRLHWKLMAFTPESHGAALIEKRTQTHFNIVVPGPAALYGKSEQSKEKHHESVLQAC